MLFVDVCSVLNGLIHKILFRQNFRLDLLKYLKCKLNFSNKQGIYNFAIESYENQLMRNTRIIADKIGYKIPRIVWLHMPSD